ncbi:MAG: GerW family sporulation protein [Oscillospiraceae bacterium]|jgi:sporulation protein YtfJ|nr:GerW family sporulation protein [Oscillospiraceae bacterium]MCR5648567.1 GerW family sporulation protein [Oscillospiraceae bacterium]
MDKHPIGSLMETTMAKLRDMVDVNTIIGTPVTTPDGVMLIPVSKVSFGFASGGSDFASKNQKDGGDNAFGGGSGAGVTITPTAFVIIKDGTVRLLSVEGNTSDPVMKVIDSIPTVIDKVKELIPEKKED